MSDLILTGGHLVDPSQNIDGPRDLLIRDGRIAAIEQPGLLKGEHTMDITGQTIAPGFVDVHVHLREPGQTYKETIATGTNAAAAGGFTTVVAMPNTVPVNDTVASLDWMLQPARNARVNLLAMPAATMGSMGALLSNFEALAKAGAVGFTDDGKPILEDPIMREALLTAGRLGLPVSQHAEDTRLTGGCSMNAGPVAFRLGLRGMTVEAESKIVERDIRLIEDIWKKDGVRAHLHVQHVSTAKALEAIRRAKADGHTVTCEAAPHHFTLTDEAIGDFNTHAKMNPPLRSELDRQAVIAALLDGTVDCIATDHAPHAAHEKEVEFERAPNGITGLETALGLALRVLVREYGMPLSRAVALLSTHPAALIHQKDRGTLRVGAPADLVLFEATQEWTYETAKTLSKSKNSPFDQAPMLGRITQTLIAGKTVYGR
ncbi:dihydroorotase [Granulicella pectinivorans]|jgi:dihydroorotase|uniref:Dihydroorotase n=1 Tax=Granulicella pectinivorans TaxID=474950 RepID=A0A1I6LDG2_9BACT|nr:dihydroorotase [Granulicella pectinivorans]SFS01531.1 dihydroorotase [Granulicella pectinivorans]